LNHTYTPTGEGGDNSHSARLVERFDSMIFRIPHGWLALDQITRASLLETLELAHEVFGVTTTIVLTLPLNNNVKTIEQLRELEKVNGMIRELVANYNNLKGKSGMRHVLLMDFGKWADELTDLNSRLAGLDKTASNYTLKRLGCAKFPPSIAMVCAEPPVEDKSCTCIRNLVSIDGLHWCMETIGGRVTAAIACLLRCPLSTDNDEDLKTCEMTCNERFMSLEPLLIP
jgi:hypothetical protein